MAVKKSGRPPFSFAYCEDLRRLPESALPYEKELHGGFAVDKRPGAGSVYYGMAGVGLIRTSPDLCTHDILKLPPELTPVNFHSTKIGVFDGNVRLFLPADNEAMVAVLTLDGGVDYVLSAPEFQEYRAAGVVFRPTDTALIGDRLFVADGYGANYVSAADLRVKRWSYLFGGKTEDPNEAGKFGTAHGMQPTPGADALTVADRPHSRLQVHGADGRYIRSYALPAGSRPCGIDHIDRDGRRYAAVASLDDPIKGRPAPIYILDAADYSVVSTVRPKEDLGVDKADHLHNVVWHEHDGRLFLVCQSWNPGFYFVLEQRS